jgi:hypothetical protein
MQQQPGLASRYQRLEKRIWAGAHRMNARYLLDGGLPREALAAYGKSLRAYAPIALTESHRILYAALCLIGLGGIKPWYFRLRKILHRH